MNSYRSKLKQSTRIAAALSKVEAKLSNKAHFVGYGVGRKMKSGKWTGGIAAIFFVDRKVDKAQLDRADRLPGSIIVGRQKIKTDVVGISPLRLLGDPTQNRNPNLSRKIRMGYSIGVCTTDVDAQLSSGTAAALVNKNKPAGETPRVLSAAHVMLSARLDTISPAHEYGGKNHDLKYGPIPITPEQNIGGVERVAPAGIDAAFAETVPAEAVIVGLGSKPALPILPVEGLPVQKSGARTGVEEGEVWANSINLQKGAAAIFDFAKRPTMLTKLWRDQKWNKKMAGLFFVGGSDFGDNGDSGALIVAASASAFASSKRYLKENKIAPFAAVGLLIGELEWKAGGG